MIPSQCPYESNSVDHLNVDVMWDRITLQNVHDEVLHGCYNPLQHLHPTTREVLKHIVRENDVEEFKFNTTFDEFKQFIKGSKEKTSTSPSSEISTY